MPPAPIWHIRLFGVLQVTLGDSTITKFRTQATGLLLARLALRGGRPLRRDILADQIWPELDAKGSRLQLNNAVYALRQISPDIPFIVSDRFNVSLDSQYFETDVATLETALKNARRTTDPAERISMLEQATGSYTDELLVGQHKEWILPERQRLQSAFDEATLELKRLRTSPQRSIRVVPTTVLEQQPSPISPPANPVEGLPPTFTRFFGRADDVAELVRLITEPTDNSLLVTIIGTGGIGKTRLALEVAKQASPAYEGRVWFVALAEVTSGSVEHIWDVIRDALPIIKEPSSNPIDQVADFLAQSPALLILDNLEQLTGSGEAAQVLNILRTRVPSLACLVTTRNVTGGEGEQLYPVGSLLKSGPGIAIEAQPAVQLFIDRARIVYHSFPTTKSSLNDVLHLCHQLEGIPLAIELAAARVNVLSPGQLLTQLKSSFAFLRSRRRDVPERHRSLFAAADSSYRLLSRELQTLFRRLSVFRAGWTLSAAEAVCTSGFSHLTSVNLLDALTELQECSLIVPLLAVHSDDATDVLAEPRFRMLETLREFAIDALRTENEEEQTRERHRDFFAAIAQNAEPHLASGGTDQARWLDKLEAEQDNLLMALETMASSGLQMATHLHRFWFLRGYANEGKRRLDELLKVPFVASEAERAKAHNALGVLAWATGDLQEAERQFAFALQLYQNGDDIRTTAGVLNNFGIVASQNGNFDVARASYTKSLEFYRLLGDTVHESVVLTNLGGVLIYLNDLPAAQAALEQALAIQKAAGDRVTVLRTLQNLAEMSMRQQDADKAAAFLRESFALRRVLADRSTFWDALVTSAAIMLKWKRFQEAAALWGAAQAMRTHAETASAPADKEDEYQMTAQIESHLKNSDAQNAESAGKGMDFEHAFRFASDSLGLGANLQGSN